MSTILTLPTSTNLSNCKVVWLVAGLGKNWTFALTESFWSKPPLKLELAFGFATRLFGPQLALISATLLQPTALKKMVILPLTPLPVCQSTKGFRCHNDSLRCHDDSRTLRATTDSSLCLRWQSSTASRCRTDTCRCIAWCVLSKFGCGNQVYRFQACPLLQICTGSAPESHSVSS